MLDYVFRSGQIHLNSHVATKCDSKYCVEICEQHIKGKHGKILMQQEMSHDMTKPTK